MKRFVVSVTTAADGSATAYSPRIAGEIHSISYVKPGSGSYTDGVGFTITKESSGEGIWTEAAVNASKTVYPRAGVQDIVGVAATLDGTRLSRSAIGIANDRVKIVLASGGNAKVGAFHILVK